MSQPEKKNVVKLTHMVNGDGTARDLWPVVPTREECTAAGMPSDYATYTMLERVWPALSVEEKEAMGFTRRDRALVIERLITLRKEPQK